MLDPHHAEEVVKHNSSQFAHGTTQSSEIVCEMRIAQLLHTLSSIAAEYTNSSVVG
jgi:hypothetical protein